MRIGETWREFVRIFPFSFLYLVKFGENLVRFFLSFFFYLVKFGENLRAFSCYFSLFGESL